MQFWEYTLFWSEYIFAVLPKVKAKSGFRRPEKVPVLYQSKLHKSQYKMNLSNSLP